MELTFEEAAKLITKLPRENVDALAVHLIYEASCASGLTVSETLVRSLPFDVLIDHLAV